MLFSQKFRERTAGQDGFTLVELLVVMLILGLLAAIAIPAFFNQRDKARDSDAKAGVRSAQTAMETAATDNDGSYDGIVVGDLTAIEPTLNNYDLTVVSATATGYEIRVDSENEGNSFTIIRASDGVLTYPCDVDGEGGCPTTGFWGGDAPAGGGGGDPDPEG